VTYDDEGAIYPGGSGFRSGDIVYGLALHGALVPRKIFQDAGDMAPLTWPERYARHRRFLVGWDLELRRFHFSVHVDRGVDGAQRAALGTAGVDCRSAAIIFSNIVWIKMHPLLGVSHSLGWLARFVASGLIAGWLLGK
jgi:hypothetical protein